MHIHKYNSYVHELPNGSSCSLQNPYNEYTSIVLEMLSYYPSSLRIYTLFTSSDVYHPANKHNSTLAQSPFLPFFISLMSQNPLGFNFFIFFILLFHYFFIFYILYYRAWPIAFHNDFVLTP